ncbi:DUF7352 domain-containing protein [Hymenobacter fodinae]|uniref:DUF7352 domain-containing protein n=1 Tax=Hymenobacter fodinae TaxID=2510796 RepID=A0A4Z0P2J4_9BACT|nr:hypothetical protein [Hymenobacter fodinae]TGE05574.1 hypothetical protein EU556_19940 [Hymenobacter fodinae]
MPRTIHKYPLKPSGEQPLPLPRGSRVLSAVEQNNSIVVYAEVDDQQQETETHTLYVYGTGHVLDHNGGAAKFIDTVKVGPYVFHVYHLPAVG